MAASDSPDNDIEPLNAVAASSSSSSSSSAAPASAPSASSSSRRSKRQHSEAQKRNAIPPPPPESDLQVLPPEVWATIAGFGVAATSALFGVLGLVTQLSVPALPHIFVGLLVLALVLYLLMLPLAWKQLPSNVRRKLALSFKAEAGSDMSPPPWALTGPAVCRNLHVLKDLGLPNEVAAARLKRHDTNDISSMSLPIFANFFIEKIYAPTRLVLISIGVLFFFLDDWEEAVVALAAILLLTSLELLAEWRGRKCLELMRNGAPQAALLLRDGVAVKVPREGVVPGDIVLLREGMAVPADLRLLQSSLLEIDESAVSREWDTAPNTKDASAIISDNSSDVSGGSSSARSSLLDRPNLALAGSVVTSGRGSGVAFATGKRTEFARRQSLVKLQEDGSDLLVLMKKAVFPLAVASAVMSLVVAGLGVWKGEDWEDVVLTTTALFLAVLPEDLPLILLSIFGIGAYGLTDQDVYFRQLSAIERLGSVDTVMTEKSGSLTENRLVLHGALVASAAVSPDDIKEATRQVPKGGPLAKEGGMESLAKLLEAWLFMSDLGDDLLRNSGREDLAVVAPQVSGVNEAEDEELLAAVKQEAKESGVGAEARVDLGTEDSEASLLRGGERSVVGGAVVDVVARGGVMDPMDSAILAAAGGPSIFTSLPYEGLEGEEQSVTRGLRPLHDQLKKLYEAKQNAELLSECAYDASIKGRSRTYRGVRQSVVKSKSVQERLLALGKRVAGQTNGDSSSSASDSAPSATATDTAAASPSTSSLDSSVRIFLQGSPEHLLQLCSSILHRGEVVSISPVRATLAEQVQAMAEQGLHLVAFASGEIKASPHSSLIPPSTSDCVFLGVMAFQDPIRPGIASAVAACGDAGVRVVMVTGDHLSTSVVVGKEAGIVPKAQGSDIPLQWLSCAEHPPTQTTGQELSEAVGRCSLFARASPTDKLCLLEALHSSGHCVAATGTTIADAPVLATSDVGLSVGDTADIVRDAAGIVLLENNFALVTLSILEGRRLLDNLRKALAFSLGSKFGLLIMVVASTVLESYPFAPNQILFLLLFIDVGAAFAFIGEPPDDDILSRRMRKQSQPFFDLQLLATIGAAAVAMAITVILAFIFAVNLGLGDAAESCAFCTWLLANSMLAMNLRTINEPVTGKGLFSNLFIILWVGAVGALLACTASVDWLRDAFNMHELSTSLWLVVIGLGIAGTWWIECAKVVLWFYKQRGYEVPQWEGREMTPISPRHAEGSSSLLAGTESRSDEV